ncbi:hypothetical protein JCM33374_g2393 [Metschnikowia sp. JCM 33374]|nr:hypothetical protein JCM33374_g2393 [Metschnikowia sp. JCM 33374]
MKVCGRLMSLTSYNFAGFPGRPDKEFYVLSLDDSSGANSSLHVMVQHGIIPVAQLEKDVLVEIIGTMSQITNGTKQLHASSVRILGKSSDVAVELAWWAEALATRKFLSIPWVYIPPNTTRVESSAPRPVFQQRDAQKRRQKQGILTPLPDHLHHNVASTSAFGCVTDSFSLYPR